MWGYIKLKIILQLAGLGFQFISELELDIDPELRKFIVPETEKTDVYIRISRDWNRFVLPESLQLGEDSICRYYRDKDTWYCLVRGGPERPLACSVYGSDCRDIHCIINEKPFLQPPRNLGSILRMIPFRAIFQSFDVLFLHSSRIYYRDKAILFSGASGAGKTTQAKLWKTCRNAQILCNDRTLIRKTGDTWYTYGYPLDGSESVADNEVVPMGTIVLLAQGDTNTVKRLSAGRAASLLMSQMVIDVWNPEARNMASDSILSLLNDIPVFLLTCTPDERAVEVLERMLIEEEVIVFG